MSGSGLEANKIVAAVLLAGVVAMVTGLASEALYKGSISEEHGKEEAKRGYTIEGAEVADAGHGGAQEEAKPVDILPLLAAADAKAGEGLVKKCTSCHTFDKGGKNGVGPNQYGLVGSHIAHKDDYTYSSAMAGMKDKRWGFQELSDFLANPKKFIPGNKMSFAGISNPKDRANLIAYLNTLSDKPLPIPKP